MRPVTHLAIVLALVAVVAAARPAGAQRVFDPDEPPDTRYRLTPWLSFGAELEIAWEFRGNYDLKRRRDDDVGILDRELTLAWSLDPTPAFQAFLAFALTHTLVPTGNPEIAGDDEDFGLDLKEAYVRIGHLTKGLSAYLGRQRYEDEREWVYDEELDAVRLRYIRGPFTVELSAGRNAVVREDLLDKREERDRINQYILFGSYIPREELQVEGYVIVQDDRAADRRQTVLVGARLRAEPIEDLDYWLELAYAGGRDGSRTVRGWGIDTGVTYEWQIGPKPAVTLGVAFGSGDRKSRDSVDTSFRQTGLQTNEGDFGGATSFRYYGEVLDPELSNLLIVTAGVGIHPSDKVSLDLVYHYYMQHHAARELRNTALEADPSGRSRHLGHEIDLVFGLAEIFDRLELKAVLGYFFPGAAFRGASGAWLGAAEVVIRF